MKKLFTFLAIAIISNIAWSQIPTYSWAKGIGSTGTDRSQSMILDASGNVYTTGYFQLTADFDAGAGTSNLISAGGNDIFFTKYDASGNFIWAKRIGNTGYDAGFSIAVDAGGNTYITGVFEGTVDFDPGAGVANFTSAGGTDVFYAKYDASGNFVWAKNIGGTGADYGRSIALDASGNIYVSGYFPLTVDFDPGAGTANLISGGGTDVFFAKYDASGNYIWAKGIAGTGGDFVFSAAVDAGGNVFITGTYTLTADFDPGVGTVNLTSAGGNDIFFAKYDANGNYSWAKSIGSTTGADLGRGVTVDASGNVYITGQFSYTADFDPGAGTANLTSPGGFYDMYFAKYDANGNYIWAKNVGGTSNDWGYGITVDAGGNVYVTGSFELTVDFDPGGGTANLTSAGLTDIYFSKYDATGNYVWAKSVGSVDVDESFNIALDAGGNIHIAGSFDGTVDFDPGVGIANLTAAGGWDIFFAKYANCSSAPSTPGTISGTTTICSGSSNTYSITAVAGATSYTWTLPSGWSGTSTTNSISTTASATSGNITVTANNTCGNSTAQTLAITVNTIPTTPGTISGTTTICSGSSNTYSITAVAGATSYTWTLPSGWSGTSTTNSISTTASTTSGNITVTANNACGNSTPQTLAVTVNTIPATPGTITGSTTICSGSSNTYSITAVAGATSYTWTLPSGWSGTSTTNSITTTASATSGNITVTANNACGNSTAQTLAVTVNTIPTTPGTISGLASMCVGSGATTYSITSVAGATSYTWTLPSGWSGTSTTNSISATPGTSGGNITVTANNSCGNSSAATLAVVVNPLPTVSYIQSPALVCINATSVALGTSSPSGGTYSGTAVTGSTFNATTAGVGTYSILYTYTDGNGCVNSASSNIVVDPCTGINQNANYNAVEIYPNPTSNILNVIANGVKQSHITIVNVIGETVYSTETKTEKIEIDMSNFQNGIYFIQIQTENRTITKKIVKQ